MFENAKIFFKKFNMETFSLFIAFFSLVLSGFALIDSRNNARDSILIAMEAIQISRQSNDIALGKKKEVPILVFDNLNDGYYLNFLNENILEQINEYNIYMINRGNIGIDGLRLEIIGVSGLTYSHINPKNDIQKLPSFMFDVNLTSIIQPKAMMSIDIRPIILKYLYLLKRDIVDKNSVHTSLVNIVLLPKSIGSTLPQGVPIGESRKDRSLFSINFNPSILENPEIQKYIENEMPKNRIYSTYD